jgi:hypothetical protein
MNKIKKILCFDIDTTLCYTIDSNYYKSKPLIKNIEFVTILKPKMKEYPSVTNKTIFKHMDIFEEIFQEYKKLSIKNPEGIDRKSFVVHKIYESVNAAFSIMTELKIKLDVPLLFCILAAYVQQYIHDQNTNRRQQ